jgi:hypothetical protein
MKITVPLTSSTIFFMVKFPFFFKVNSQYISMKVRHPCRSGAKTATTDLGAILARGAGRLALKGTHGGRLRSRHRTEDDGKIAKISWENPTGKDEEHPLLRESFSWIL